ncbi:hypothetical protein SAY87_024104 [Trapa incisa]|uniref:Virilizer N-terminal domain-containing protein n=1 Tax=Trapa incisa TaxID=236973 RepID=A0AAN7KTP8_9MYRT|nr:hypothetical protein SAY87_024104 [Trapa incisa]
MGRPEPCVLFAQTFVHPHLDEYVDEVLFAEPVVVTACEFLEQSAPSACQSVALVGATSPPSFALEVFVQCEGETRFRRLCQPFLYSHSSSNVLEVEAVLTNHMVLRGSYRSLSLVVYGNTAEDLGQFNIELDDSSLTGIVSSADGNLEDLPLPLHFAKFKKEKLVYSLQALFQPVSVLDLSAEVKQLLQLVLKILEVQELGDAVHKVLDVMVSAASDYITQDLPSRAISQKPTSCGRSKESKELLIAISESNTDLAELYKVLQNEPGDTSVELSAEYSLLDHDTNPVTSKLLVDMFHRYFHFESTYSIVRHPMLSKSKDAVMWLSVAIFLCSARESCFHFVNGGGMERLTQIGSFDLQNSAAVVLLFLGVIEQATRHSIGCEGLLGWWPREDENIPLGTSKGYNQLLKLLLQKPRHDVASIASNVLRRLRTYEVASRYEYAVLSVLRGLSIDGLATSSLDDMLSTAKSQLKHLQKLLNLHGPIEDPSQVAEVRRSLILGQSEGSLSYKATSCLITSSGSHLSNWDFDPHLLALLKERGFLPLSAALLSSPVLCSAEGHRKCLYMEITLCIGAMIFSLLLSRSGLLFLASEAELSALLIQTLKGSDSKENDECAPLQYASNLLSKGFFCGPREVGMIFEMHLRVINAIDQLLMSAPHSEEFLWVLWEFSAFSRSDYGRQALLVIGHFPEAISVLIEALHCVKEPEPDSKASGASPLDVAIFHSAAEIFEIIVMDTVASSLGSWIGYAVDLHRALHSSSPGSNRKDAPTRLLEWIDAGVVYHKNGVTGLLRYAAVLASGGDAPLASTSILVSDLMDVEDAVGDPSGAFDLNVVENLGKLISEKTFEGVVLRDSAVAQLTTAIRILAFISENTTVAAELYDQGAMTVLYSIIVNCTFMLERSSNSYDYLVDDGTECNSTSDLLSERNREQSLVDLLVPSLLWLIALLHKLQQANEQHRNTKLMTALLRLHREVSPKLAACAADLSLPYPNSALVFEAVCHLIVSALAYWPVYGWTPGLFHSLLTNVEVTSLMALGPKETCSMLCLMNDLFPEEGVQLWKNDMPLLSSLRSLAIGTIFGPQKEREVNWYLMPENHEKVLSQLTPQLGKIAEMIQHCVISDLIVIQDMLRVFIVRIACQNVENASILLRPIFSWISENVSNLSVPSEIDAYKIYRYIDFLFSLLEHPQAKALVLKEGIVQILTKVMQRCLDFLESESKDFPENSNSADHGFTMLSWCLPALKSVSLLYNPRKTLQQSGRKNFDLSSGDCAMILPILLNFFQALPIGKELIVCVGAFNEFISCTEGLNALLDAFAHIHAEEKVHEQNIDCESNPTYDPKGSRWTRSPPLLCCWKKLCDSIISNDDHSSSSVEAINILSAGCISFSRDGKSLDVRRVNIMKHLFGLSSDVHMVDGSLEENLNYIQEVTTFLNSKVAESVKSLLVLLQEPSSSIDMVVCELPREVTSLLSQNISTSRKYSRMDGSYKSESILQMEGLLDKFLWECPEILPDKGGNVPTKRKLAQVEGMGRRARGENPPDVSVAGSFSRGSGPPASSGPTRRDTFRLRKPNTSRPPSMHVDDYVARERNVDGGTDVIAIPRAGSSSGRPPSIHVDEFMARQRERQNSLTTTVVGDASNQLKTSNPSLAPNDEAHAEKISKKELKATTDQDDDINIVFDGEDSEPDNDKSLFPQLDENLQQSSPPRSIVEETDNDIQEGGQFSLMTTPVGSNADENIAQSEFSSRMSVVSRAVEKRITRELSVTSEKKFDQPSDQKDVMAANSSGFPVMYPPSGRGRNDSRMSPQATFMKQSPQHMGNNLQFGVGQGQVYDQKFLQGQPPLPPMPPPPTLMPQSSDSVPGQHNPVIDVQSSLPSPFQVPPDYASVRPLPPLPPTPPPFLSSTYNPKPSSLHPTGYGQTNTGTEFTQSSGIPIPHSAAGTRIPSYPPSQLMTPVGFNRTASPTMSYYSGSQIENPNIHSLPQLQPLQPPLFPPQPPPHHLRPPTQSSSQQADHGLPMQSFSPLQVHPVQQQMLQQQPQVLAMSNAFYQTQPPEPSHTQLHQQGQVLPQQGDVASNQQEDPGVSLSDFFRSPEDIQALLSNREKLCQLLEQHPRLMQMLQERLGQL